MGSSDLTPLHYSTAQLVQMLGTPTKDQDSNIAIMTNPQSIYASQAEQQLNSQQFPGQGYASGGMLRHFASGGSAATTQSGINLGNFGGQAGIFATPVMSMFAIDPSLPVISDPVPTPTAVATPQTFTNSFGGIEPAFQDTSGSTPIVASGQSNWKPSTSDYLHQLGILALAKGGLIAHLARGGQPLPNQSVMDELLNNHTTLTTQDQIAAEISGDKHVKKMFDVEDGPHARPENVSDTLAEYDTPQGQDYLAARRNMVRKASGGAVHGYNIHDMVNGGGGAVGNMEPLGYASGGRVQSLLHKFKSFVPAVNPMPRTHYRDSMGNNDLASVRSMLRIKHG